jgi:hypothetical protein
MRGLDMGRIYKSVILRNAPISLHAVAFVDSGSDTTILSQRISRQLGIKLRAKSSVMLPDGRMLPTKTGIVTIEVPRDGLSQEIAVDISDVPFEEDVDDLDVILGLDFLQENGIRLSFRKPKKSIALTAI